MGMYDSWDEGSAMKGVKVSAFRAEDRAELEGFLQMQKLPTVDLNPKMPGRRLSRGRKTAAKQRITAAKQQRDQRQKCNKQRAISNGTATRCGSNHRRRVWLLGFSLPKSRPSPIGH